MTEGRDLETVERLENWAAVYGRRGRSSPWGTPPWVSLERKCREQFGHEEPETDDETPEPPKVSAPKPRRPIDYADADVVSRALCHPLLPPEHKRLLIVFYTASEHEWRAYGRLCRKAGTMRKKGETDLIKAEWRLGSLLRQYFPRGDKTKERG